MARSSNTNQKLWQTPMQLQQQQAPRQRRLVLSEEDYTATLSSIVQREYFPQISELERQNALLECRSRGDIAGAVAVRRATRQLIEHEQVVEERRLQDDQDNDVLQLTNSDSKSFVNVRKRPRPLSEETLTGFHSRVTNEDDQEFDSNLKQEIQTHRQNLQDCLLLKASPASDQITNEKRLQDGTFFSLDEMASDDFAPESNRISINDGNRPPPEAKNALFFNPTPLRGAPKTQLQLQSTVMEDKSLLLTDSSATAAFDPSFNTNQMMLPPTQSQTKAMLISKLKTTKQNLTDSKYEAQAGVSSLILEKSQLVEYIPKYCLEMKIDPTQTRFPSTQMPGQGIVRRRNGGGLVEASDTEHDDYLSSTDDSYYSTDLDAPLRPLEQERQHRLRRLQKQQQQSQKKYSFVAMSPQILPGGDTRSIVDQTTIMKWSASDSTPLIVSGREKKETEDNTTSSSSYLIPAPSQRDQAAQHAELELQRRAKRTKQSNNNARSSLSSTSRKNRSSSSFTSAYQSRFSKTAALQRLSSRSRDAFGSSLRGSYSSTPIIHRSSSSSSNNNNRNSQHHKYKKDRAFAATPQL